MTIRHGNDLIQRLYYGGMLVPAVYYGVQQVHGGTVAPPDTTGQPHRYWRLRIMSGNDGSRITILRDVELRGTNDGPDLTGSGTPLGSAPYYSTDEGVDKAFDSDGISYWQGGTDDSTGLVFIGYDFSSPVSINQVRLKIWTDYLDRTPRGTMVESSDDGAVWSVEWFIAGRAPTWLNEFETYTRPGVTATSWWLLLSEETEIAGSHIACSELRPINGNGAILPFTALASSYRLDASYSTSKMNDNNINSFWHASDNDRAKAQWVGFNMGSPVPLAGFRYSVRNDGFPHQRPVRGSFWSGSDGRSWRRRGSFIDAGPAMTNGETRDFTF